MKFLKACKKIIFKLCGKARWHVLALVLILAFTAFTNLYEPIYPYFHGITDENDSFRYEFSPEDKAAFSINRNGDIALRNVGAGAGAVWVGNLDTGEQKYTGLSTLIDSLSNKTRTYFPHSFALTDSGDLYAVQEFHYNIYSSYCEKESVICLSGDYKLKDKVFSIDYRPEFREAVRLFQMGRRDDARKALEKIDKEGRSDYVSKMYLEYIKGLSSDDKSNVFRFTRK